MRKVVIHSMYSGNNGFFFIVCIPILKNYQIIDRARNRGPFFLNFIQ